MRITKQLLRSRSKKPLNHVRYIDLSGSNIVTLDNVDLCPKLTTLVARNNNIDSVHNLDCCPELWKCDFSHNKLQNLNGFSRFSALGCLILSNNSLGWSNLQNISHIHILQLSLHGNSKLEKDPYYRMHVIDLLPHVWMLDGKLITSAEREQVSVFFKTSALSDRPVRHKFPKKRFTPTVMKNLPVTGVFGEKTIHWMKRFPLHEKESKDLDERRLRYLAYGLTEDLLLQSEYDIDGERFPCKGMLLNLLDQRDTDKEKTNMLLLLLVAFIEFRIPEEVIEQTLHIANLGKTGSCDTTSIFQLSKRVQCSIASLLLSGVKIDRDAKLEDGFYDRLYLCLCGLVSEWHKLSNGDQITRNHGLRTVLAAEVVQLFCIVPAFLFIVSSDSGLLELVSCATQDPNISSQISAIVTRGEENDGRSDEVYQEIGFYIMRKVQERCPRVVRSRGKVIQTKSAKLCSPCLKTSSCEHDVVGVNTCQERAKSAYHARNDDIFQQAACRTKFGKYPRAKTSTGSAYKRIALGDKVATENEYLNVVVALPEKNIAVIRKEGMTGRLVSRPGEVDDLHDQFSYVDTETLQWFPQQACWYPKEKNKGQGDKNVHRKSKTKDACSGAFVTGIVKRHLPVELWMSVTPLEVIQKTESIVPKSVDDPITSHVRKLVKECIREANSTVDERETEPKPESTSLNKNSVQFADILPAPSEASLPISMERERAREISRNWKDLSDDDMITKNETDRLEAWRCCHLRNLEGRTVTSKKRLSTVAQPVPYDSFNSHAKSPDRSFYQDVYTNTGKRLSYPLPGWIEEFQSNNQRNPRPRAATARHYQPATKGSWTPIISAVPVTRKSWHSPSPSREKGNYYDNAYDVVPLLHAKRHQSAKAVLKRFK